MKKTSVTRLKALIITLLSICILSSALLITSCGGTKGIEYKLNDEGTAYSVVGYKGEKTTVKIPEKHEGLPVVAIGNQAFKENETVKVVYLPSTVEEIGTEAFASCPKLENVHLPTSVKYIGSACFRDSNVLREITLPNGIESIPLAMFYNCTSLKTLNLPATLKTLDPLSFIGCSKLETITVASGNTDFTVSGNCLISKADKTIVLGGSDCTIPDDGSAVAIGSNAFYGRSEMRGITIPASIERIEDLAFSGSSLRQARIYGPTEIGERAFSSCRGLSYVVLSTNVSMIGDLAFGDCKLLTKVYYEGTAEEWGGVFVTNPDKQAIGSAKVFFYSETKPAEEGNFWHYENEDVVAPWYKE